MSTHARGVVELALPGIAALDQGVPLLGQLADLAPDAARQVARLLLRVPVVAGVAVLELPAC